MGEHFISQNASAVLNFFELQLENSSSCYSNSNSTSCDMLLIQIPIYDFEKVPENEWRVWFMMVPMDFEIWVFFTVPVAFIIILTCNKLYGVYIKRSPKAMGFHNHTTHSISLLFMVYGHSLSKYTDHTHTPAEIFKAQGVYL